MPRHENHLVAVQRLAMPRAVLTDERAPDIVSRQQLAFVENKIQRCRLRAERVIGHGRTGSEIGTLRFEPLVDMLSRLARIAA
jgi:hypothetical protein